MKSQEVTWIYMKKISPKWNMKTNENEWIFFFVFFKTLFCGIKKFRVNFWKLNTNFTWIHMKISGLSGTVQIQITRLRIIQKANKQP